MVHEGSGRFGAGWYMGYVLSRETGERYQLAAASDVAVGARSPIG